MRIKYFARDKNMRPNCHANQVVGVTKVSWILQGGSLKIDRLGWKILSTLLIKGEVLHRARGAVTVYKI